MYLKEHLEKLNHFYEVAKAGSIKEGANSLNLTQPSVTKSIKILEEAINKQLFVRQPRGVILTNHGEVLLNYCHSLFAQLDDVEVRLTSPGDPMAGSIRVGTYDSIAIYFWPKFLRGFLKTFPRVDLELTTGRSQSIQKMIESGELDLGLIIEPTPSANIKVLNLSKDSFQLYRSTKMTNSIEEDPKTPLIFMPDALAGENKSRLMHLIGKDSSRRKQFKTSSLESTKELTISGLGIGLLPNMVAKDALKRGVIKQIHPKGFSKLGIGQHKIGLAFSKNKEDSPLLQGIISEIKKQSW